MRSVASDSGESTITTADEQPADRHAEADSAISWETTAGNWNRLRSVGIGGLLGLGGVGCLLIGRSLPALVGEISVDVVLTLGVVLFVLTPFLIHARDWAAEEVDPDTHQLRQQLEWSSVRLGWVGCGAAIGGGVLWVFTGVQERLYAIQLTVVFASLLVQNNRGTTTTVDPEAGVIEREQPNRTKRRSLDNTVKIRRGELFGRSLFVFANRGKQWYKGPHLLAVPAAVAPEVAPRLRRMAAESGTPDRIDRSERLIIGGVGASMLLMGPLLYILLGEGALLAIAVGPSAIVAHFALMHAHRA